jgi:hypothetical protein
MPALSFHGQAFDFNLEALPTALVAEGAAVNSVEAEAGRIWRVNETVIGRLKDAFNPMMKRHLNVKRFLSFSPAKSEEP